MFLALPWRTFLNISRRLWSRLLIQRNSEVLFRLKSNVSDCVPPERSCSQRKTPVSASSQVTWLLLQHWQSASNDTHGQLPFALMAEGFDYISTNREFLAPDEPGFSPVIQDVLAPVSPRSTPYAGRAMTPTAKPTVKFTSGVLPENQRVMHTSRSLKVSHASPLAPLRSRDREALDDFFDGDNASETALDVHRCLSRLYPEPCWEDEPYEFLNGYI